MLMFGLRRGDRAREGEDGGWEETVDTASPPLYNGAAHRLRHIPFGTRPSHAETTPTHKHSAKPLRGLHPPMYCVSIYAWPTEQGPQVLASTLGLRPILSSSDHYLLRKDPGSGFRHVRTHIRGRRRIQSMIPQLSRIMSLVALPFASPHDDNPQPKQRPLGTHKDMLHLWIVEVRVCRMI